MTAFFSWQHAVRSAKLEPTTKLVCYTIWSHMASDGTGCFPSYALIAEESGLSRRCVIEHVQKAERAGFLQIDARQRDNGSATSNMYLPIMPRGGEPAALGGERGSLGGGEPAAPPEDTTLSNNPSKNTPQPPKGAERFGDFWSAWPDHGRKRDKARCERAWRNRKLDTLADEILSALEAWKAGDEWRKESGRFIPAPVVWLNNNRWEAAPKRQEQPKWEEWV